MKFLHTKLPEFIRKMEVAAATAGKRPKNYKLEGMENLKTAKLQSLKTGRIENAVEELARRDDVEEIQLLVRPRVPETLHTIIIKGINKDGKTQKIILENISILHGPDDLETFDCDDIEDRRAPMGKQG
ncbi:hypothetical protein [Clostridium transplantifaecale]|uniref:hypothetical protein n=1 Tax=Clostridium transplantifaecale TaxID=2479838 RepID=UPI001FAB2F6E|nr:hypothetical protein [Clostridium transplantifaecale]